MYFLSFTVLGLVGALLGVLAGYALGLRQGREGLRNDIITGRACRDITPKQFRRWVDATKDL